MRGFRTLLLVALIPICFITGVYGGPWLRQAYYTMFPAPEYEAGNYQDLYSEAEESVVVFSTSTCPFCKQARKLLDAHGVAYKDYVVDLSDEANRIFKQRGGDVVPVVYIGGRKITGFSEKAILDALAAAKGE